MILVLILYRVFLRKKYETFIEIMGIVSFCAILEFVNTILLAWADTSTLKTDFWLNLTSQAITSPIKIFWNLAIILTTYKIISPLIKSKEAARF